MLRTIFINDLSDEFNFILAYDNDNSNKRTITIKTSINKARAISKTINHLSICDPTISDFEIIISENKFNNLKLEEFSQILNLLLDSTFKPVSFNLDAKLREIFDELQFLLGNSEKVGKNREIQSIECAISFLSTQSHELSIQFLVHNMMDFLKSQFTENISHDVFHEIFSLFEIQIPDLERPSDFLNNILDILIEKNDRKLLVFFILHVPIEYTTIKMKEELVVNIDDEMIANEFSTFSSFIKSYLLSSEIILPYQKKIAEKIITINENDNSELNGIISYLLRKEGKDILTNGSLTLSAVGSLNPIHPIECIIEYGELINSHFYNYYMNDPTSEDGSWIQFDFDNRTIKLTAYSIRTNKNYPDWYHPKSWRIVGSNNLNEWKILDHRIDNEYLHDTYKLYRFSCDENDENYRYIRYIQEDSQFNRKYNIQITCFELFGELHEFVYT
ncbi:hypothetical protein TRFO_31783 [Tritrichomonas foetus]|uniref:F5/8 type C domain-containing protein n=1 Tax=Tritrichomonas foetus TaxID=1144522 RepID=A0A1J4JSK9_9EUKA|nr:hypothetical protein TRFO_31783 [Tritrichomonas foetus]|eukprot:OHT01408.1 hypothetical protein TRFO_31783 [Tritrichomonas foetus]